MTLRINNGGAWSARSMDARDRLLAALDAANVPHDKAGPHGDEPSLIIITGRHLEAERVIGTVVG